MYRVVKRDGKAVDFDLKKISDAITKAFEACKKDYHPDVINLLALRVTSDFASKVKDEKISVEEIQDSVEKTLSEAGYPDVAKAYILYRKQREKTRNISASMLDYKKLVDSYVNAIDWRVKENSTVTYSVGGLILSNSGAVTANYWLSEVYDQEIGDAHRNGEMHIHDLSMLTGYCAGWSLRQLITEGLGGVNGKITSTPANHLSTLCNQMVNFLGIMQNEWAGAQAFSSFDTYLAPFVKVDNLTYKEVKQNIQSFIYGVNTPSRWGTQAPFTNVTLDWTVPEDLAEQNCVVGGKEMDFKYKDCKKEMDMINKAFIEVMIEGDANGRGFQYPIPTYSITKEFDWSETENNKLLFEMTAKYGTPYFSNYVNSDMKPSDIRSMCPMTPDTKVIVRSEQNGVRIAPIKDIYQTCVNHETKYEVWTPFGWKLGKPVATDKTKVLKITLSNGSEVKLGINHLQPTKENGVLHADELQVGMKLPFSKKAFDSSLGTKELGFVIGAYAGDGSRDDNAIVYSLDANEKDDETERRIVDFWNSIGFECKTSFGNRNVRFVRVNGNPYSIVEYFIGGKSALDKVFNNSVYKMSAEFREGLIEGYRATDGAREKNRLYTSSLSLKEGLCFVLSSLGKKYSCNYIDEREGRLGTNSNYRIDFPERENYGDKFCEDENYIYYTITNIEEYDYIGKQLYCFEVDNDEHLFTLASGLVTHNCRLRLDLRELRKKSGGFFGSGESTGSVGVVTLNLPRIAYLASDKEDFYKRLDKLMDIAARSLHVKREVITKLLDNGLYPYTKRYLGTFNNHFSTIGLVGMNEACLNANWIRKDLTEKQAQDFAEECLNYMRNRLIKYQEQYHDLYNLEATPAESTSYRLAKHDKEKYPDIITAGKDGETPYYTNSSHLPVGYTEDIFAALDIQDRLQTLYTSGTVFHTFLGEKLPDWKAAANLVKKISDNYKLPYYTMSPTYSICPDHGYITGEAYTCPKCGKKTEVWSRITGYYRPVQNWNDGKVQEFKHRKEYNLDSSVLKAKEIISEVAEAKKNEDTVIPSGNDVLTIYVQDHCPKCKGAEQRLQVSGIEHKVVNCTENMDEAARLNLTETPTIIDPDGSRFVGANAAAEWMKYHQSK